MTHRSGPKGGPAVNHWDVRSSEQIADARVFRVMRKVCRHPARGIEHDFFVMESVDWVNVVAVTGSGGIVLVNQFRFGIESLSLEVPGGLINAGEDPVAAALRELREETGFAGRNARLMGSVHPNPAIQNNRCHLVAVENVEHLSPQEWDEHEEIEVRILPVDEALGLARSGGITHALTLNALFLFEPRWHELRSGI